MAAFIAQEEQQLVAILQQRCLAIHHIGSTAIPPIHAKPIIDILPVVDDIDQIESWSPLLSIKERIPYFRHLKTKYHFPLRLKASMFYADLVDKSCIAHLKFKG